MSEPQEPGTDNSLDDLLDVLSSPLDDDDAELTAVLTRRPRAKLPSLTLILLAIVVASAGFLGGALVGKHYGSSGTGNLAAAFRGLAAARAGASSSASAGSGTGSGATVYVQTTAGDVVQVATSSGTKVTVSSTVPVKDLQPGETVIVEGSKNSSGAIAATSISQTSLGGGGFGAGGG
jgi:hypothetical protein